jgi:two-component system, cell cycle sensor histidine kinase and response regulator CckA
MPSAALYRAILLVNPLQWSIFLSAAEAIGPLTHNCHLKEDITKQDSQMRATTGKHGHWMDSIVVTGVGLAALYWVCESFMFFFLAPEANIFHHILGPNLFEVWTRLLVLCIFVIFVSHVRQDIDKRRLAFEKMREQDEKYRLIIENIDEGFFELDLEGRFSFVSDPACEILRYRPEELIGTKLSALSSPKNTADIDRLLKRVFRTGESSRATEVLVSRKDDSEVTLELSVYSLRNTEGQPIGCRGMVRDVSERIESEKEKAKLEKQLIQAQKMEAIGNLAGGIAHDFNNILMGMQGNASLMLLTLDSHHPHYAKVKAIERYVESGAALTRQLLGFARGGKYEVKITKLDELVRRTARMFGRTKKEIRIHTDGLVGVRSVEVDQSQIEQVLLNILVNAWHAMPGGGEIFLKTANVDIDATVVRPYRIEPGPYVCMSITDTGIGMDQATQQRIFEPFFTTKEMGRGTGLGLASAYGIIKNHGGFIEADSSPGEGATFRIYLPASGKAVFEEEESVTELFRGDETVLLVDDEQVIIEVGQEILKALGYNVLVATSGYEALKIFRRKKDAIALVILDMVMPGLSGGETFDQLKTVKPDVRVLLCSGYSLSGQATEILDRGCSGFIQKPFKLKELSVKLREILDQ